MKAKQIEALKYLIIKSKDADDLAKRILFFLIDKSEGLTKEVSMTVWEGDAFSRNTVNKAAENCNSLKSCSRETHLGELLALIGSEMHFSYHRGHYVDGRLDIGDQQKMRYTFWLAKEMHGHGGMGEHITFSPEELSGLELASSLYQL